jgi:hypothetical protein
MVPLEIEKGAEAPCRTGSAARLLSGGLVFYWRGRIGCRSDCWFWRGLIHGLGGSLWRWFRCGRRVLRDGFMEIGASGIAQVAEVVSHDVVNDAVLIGMVIAAAARENGAVRSGFHFHGGLSFVGEVGQEAQ